MTEARAGASSRRPARHERPTIDEAGLAAARELGAERWVAFFEPLPDHLRDDEAKDLRATATRCRAAYGPKDSVRDALPPDVTEPFLESIDRLLKQLNRRDTGAA